MRFVSLLILLFVVRLSFCQETMNWEQCANYALENNLNLKKQDLNTKLSILNVNSAKSAFLPSISASSGYNKSYGRSIDPETNDIINRDFFSNSYGLSGSIGLFQGFRRINNLQFQKYNALYSKAEFESLNNSTVFLVLENYFNTLFYKGMYSIALEQISVSSKGLYKTQKMYDLGRASQSDIIDYEAQLAKDSLSAVQYEMQWELSLSDLKQSMNFPLDEPITLEETNLTQYFSSPISTDKEMVMSQAKQHLPEVEMLEYQLKAAKKRLAETYGYASPSLSLSASWGSGYYETTTDTEGNIIPFNEQIKGNAQKGIGLSLSIPIFSRFNNYNSIQQAKINYDISRTEYQRMQTELEYEIQQNLLELEAAQKEYRMATINKEKQELAFKTAEKKLEKGLIDLIDYSDIKNQYAQSQSEVLRTSIQLFLRYKTIQFYLTGEIL